MLVAHFSLFCAVVVFGFNPDSYTVDESAGTVNIGVEFLMGSFGTALISVQLTLSTLDGTANGNTEEPMVDTCLGVKGASVLEMGMSVKGCCIRNQWPSV